MSEKFQEFETNESFESFLLQQKEDDDKLKQMFAEQNHKEFQYSLINLGVCLDIIRGFFYFEKQRLEDNIIKLKSPKTKGRRVNAMLNELNQKINLRFGLDEETEIISSFCIYEKEGYLMINKSLFVDLLMEKADTADIL